MTTRSSSDQEEILKGLAASSGVVTGTVKIVFSPADFGKMEAGDILVAPFTTPTYTPVMVKASGFITDVGGRFAHAAIVAREFGIPAVVGTGEATKVLKDGMEVTVDGTNGRVLR